VSQKLCFAHEEKLSYGSRMKRPARHRLRDGERTGGGQNKTYWKKLRNTDGLIDLGSNVCSEQYHTTADRALLDTHTHTHTQDKTAYSPRCLAPHSGDEDTERQRGMEMSNLGETILISSFFSVPGEWLSWITQHV